jgi:hypothetical protein
MDMRPVTETDIRSAFVNCSQGEAKGWPAGAAIAPGWPVCQLVILTQPLKVGGYADQFPVLR